MRPALPRMLVPLLPALALLACVAPDPSAAPTSTPELYRGPVASPTARLPVTGPLATWEAGRRPPAPPAPTAEPATPTPLRADAALQRALQELLGPEAEHYGVYAKELRGSRGAAINATKVFNAASTFKVEVMFEVYRQRDLGLLKFDELLEVNAYYAGFDLGTLPVEVGDSMSIAEALFYMMSVSDNVSAVLLQDRVGASNINKTMTALGLKSTGLFPEGLPATAEDFGLLLEAIAASEDVPESTRREMLDLMASESRDNGLVAGVPRGTRVAHKTGNWPDATNHVGIVQAPAATYVIAILCDLGYQPTLIRAISETVYRHLGQAAR
ncbi:MAG TPA: serine hydrolase [Dehalococcoidia bacterium]|nr:serine hydrolase [Dehalococcoidia bacterium]